MQATLAFFIALVVYGLATLLYDSGYYIDYTLNPHWHWDPLGLVLCSIGAVGVASMALVACL